MEDTGRQPLGGFVFEPRNMIEGRKQFGQSSLHLKPAAGCSESDPRYLAALLQHRVANRVRESLLAEGSSLQELAKLLGRDRGMSYDRLVRIQRGETMMQITDLMQWANRYAPVRQLLAEERFGHGESASLTVD